MRSDGVVLDVSEASVRYGSVEAIRDVSLTIRDGEIVAIIGANGAGKTTLMKAVAGLLPLAAGRIAFDSQDLASVPSHRRVTIGLALCPEGRGIFPDQSVRDNLVLGAVTKAMSRPQLEARLEREFLRFPRLRERQDQVAGTLSGGEQQMLAIARALMSDPRLLLLDEPSLGLAPTMATNVFRTLVELKAAGLTCCLVEQMARQALGIADRAYVLENGRVVLEGSGRDLLRSPKVRDAYLAGGY